MNKMNLSMITVLLVGISCGQAPQDKALINMGSPKKTWPKFNIVHAGEYKLTDKIAVIVEPRKHELLVPVIKNAMAVLGDEWKIQVFHGTENAEFIRNSELNAQINSGRILLSSFGLPDLKNPLYSRLFLSEYFWENVFGENVLIFQTDSILCSKSLHKIDEFLKFDYIGTPLALHDHSTDCYVYKEQPTSESYKVISGVDMDLKRLQAAGAVEIQYHKTQVGNGGLSVRKRSKTLNALKNFHPVGEFIWAAEDDYYSCVAMDPRTNMQAADFETAKTFSITGIHEKHAFGAHQPWSPPETTKISLDNLGQWCTEFETILRPHYRLKEKK